MSELAAGADAVDSGGSPHELKGPPSSRRARRAGRLVGALALAFVAVATLTPTPGTPPTPPTCIVCGRVGGVDVLLNVLLFVPLGLGLRLAGLSRWRALALAGLTTLGIESLQFAVVTGRDASLSDLL